MQRRDFLKLSVASLLMSCPAIGAWPGRAFAAPKGRECLVFCSSEADTDPSLLAPVGHSGNVQCVDRISGESFSVKVPFFGHAVTQNPASRNHVVTFEKWGKHGALVDLHNREAVSIAPAEGYIFFGHSSFTPDGHFFIASEDTYDHKNGILTVRDSKTLKIERSLSSFGKAPHECKILADGKTILAAIQGDVKVDKPSLVWIDLDTGKLLDKREYGPVIPKGQLDVEAGGSGLHASVTHDGWIVCGGAGYKIAAKHNDGTIVLEEEHRRAFLFFVSPEGQFYYPELPEEIRKHMDGEALSIAVLGKTGLAAITISFGNVCLVFDYKTQKLVQILALPDVKGVVPLNESDDAGHGVIMLSGQGLFEGHLNPGQSPDIVPMNSKAHGIGKHLTRIYI